MAGPYHYVQGKGPQPWKDQPTWMRALWDAEHGYENARGTRSTDTRSNNFGAYLSRVLGLAKSVGIDFADRINRAREAGAMLDAGGQQMAAREMYGSAFAPRGWRARVYVVVKNPHNGREEHKQAHFDFDHRPTKQEIDDKAEYFVNEALRSGIGFGSEVREGEYEFVKTITRTLEYAR